MLVGHFSFFTLTLVSITKCRYATSYYHEDASNSYRRLPAPIVGNIWPKAYVNILYQSQTRGRGHT